ncbi:MAG: NAD-dependent protein deacylase [Atopostipes suicloacalis]|nr:NAD-dependent protein deacylase [Atopostipes suicloacalis]
MNQKFILLNQYIEQANIVSFFGGAGVSTESGIPDYRSRDGRYTKMREEQEDPRKILNRRYIKNHPVEFFNRPRKKRPNPKPNMAHKVLADLEKNGKDIRVLTQNVDGLHQKAGHRYVLELHGNGRTWFCMKCGRVYLPEEVERDEQNVPRCYVDQGIVRPSITYFGENPKKHVIEKAKAVIAKSDLLIIAGTSLTVYPVKNLIHYFKGKRVVVINKEELDTGNLDVDLFIQGAVGETFSKLV